MEGGRDGQFHRLLQAQLGGLGDRGIDGGHGTGNDNLPRRVVVGDLTYSRFKTGGDGRCRQRLVGPQKGGHGALADRNGFLHGLTAQFQQFGRIAQAQGPGRSQS